MGHRIFLRMLTIGFFAIGISLVILSYIFQNASAADTTVNIAADTLTSDSVAVQKGNKKIFAVSGRDGKLYRSRQRGAAGVYEFLNKNINIKDGQDVNLSQLPQKLQPERIVDDQQDPILQRAGKAANRKHYYFKQKIKDLDVFGSRVAVHQKDDADVYAFDGVVLDDSSLQRERLTADQARLLAKNFVQKQNNAAAQVIEAEKFAVNPKMLGISEDENTYPAMVVVTAQTVGQLAEPRRTIVSLYDGSVLQSVVLADDLLSRRVYDCAENPTGSCSLKRSEGAPAANIADVDSMYGFLGDVYNFYSSKMQRDSYDNAGSSMDAFVNLPATLNGEKICPNARWTRKEGNTGNQLQVCPGWVTKDIVGHELTHGVVEYTANLDFEKQAGALNEAIADIFAMGVDTDDWSIGEDLSIGAIRFLDDPGKNRTLSSTGGTAANPMPDRLFSTRYYCGTSDRGGVHINMSVPTKGFYLMSVGGSFNGCSMTPLGKDKALLIWYQGLTKYMSTTSNFRDTYNAMVQGCADLYGAGSAECTQTKKSLQAVEMDKQTVGDQDGPKCLNVPAGTPTCVGSSDPSPTPTTQTSSPTPVITGVACTTTQGDANGDNKVTVLDYELWRRAMKAVQ